MKTENVKNCKLIRNWLKKFLARGLKFDNARLYEHVLNCHKCQQRMVSINKVENAIMMVKSQIHQSDLLARANKQAIGVLKTGLRNNPTTASLKNAYPKPSLMTTLRHYNGKLVNIAACFVVFVLVKTHIYNSIEDFQSTGEKIVSNYYEKQLGQDLANELKD